MGAFASVFGSVFGPFISGIVGAVGPAAISYFQGVAPSIETSIFGALMAAVAHLLPSPVKPAA